MVTIEFEKLVARINFLYHKSQGEGLTEAERKEQSTLRRQYLDTLKGNFRNQLEQIKFTTPWHECSGHDCDCKKKH